jgi:hypothetical protein
MEADTFFLSVCCFVVELQKKKLYRRKKLIKTGGTA